MCCKRKMIRFVCMVLLLISMSVPVFAVPVDQGIIEEPYKITEVEFESGNLKPMPRYSANIDFSEIPVSNAVHGSNKFNLPVGAEITVNFQSSGKFSVALYNYDNNDWWISSTVHSGSCYSTVTIGTAGNWGIGVYNRDSKTIRVTGSYSL